MIPLVPEFDVLIAGIAKTFQLPGDLFAAQVLAESSGDPFAFRYEEAYFRHYIKGKRPPVATAASYGPLAACSYGLTQILLETATEHGFAGRPEDLFDPQTNLMYGARHMDWCRTKAKGNYVQGLAAYNEGFGNTVGDKSNVTAYVLKIYTLAGRQDELL